MFDAFLFDLDGTLVDTIQIYHQAVVDTFIKHGVDVDMTMWRKAVEEIWEIEDWVRAYPALGPDPKALRVEWKRNFDELYNTQLEVKPGAEILLIDLLKQRAPLALVSQTTHDVIDRTIDQLVWRDVFLTVVSAVEDVKTPKPAPDVYLRAALMLGVKAENCLVFEDNLGGLRGAKAAGMSCIICPDSYMKYDKSIFGAADAVVDSLKEVDWNFLENLYQTVRQKKAGRND
jgi:HAD superfamily hydrolase (TIGR01509 family)